MAELDCPNCGFNIENIHIPPDPVSPLPEFRLNTNDALTDTETISVKIVIDTVKTECHALDNKISSLKGLLSALEAARQRREDFLHKHRRMLSIVRRVPREIWSLIFTIATVDAFEESDERKTVLAFQTPLTSLTWICSSWRDIAVQSPVLWSYICIKPEVPTDVQLSLLQRFLSRSGSVPLTICLQDNTHTIHSGRPTANREHMYAMLSTNSWRWKSASISLHDRNLPSEASPLKKAEFGMLESLSIRNFQLIRSNVHLETPLFTATPRLSSLSLFVLDGSRLDLTQKTLNWSSLTTVLLGQIQFTGSYIPLCIVLDVLRWSPRLTALAAYSVGVSKRFNQVELIQHQHLERLSLVIDRCYDQQLNFYDVFKMLSFPSLVCLELTDIRASINDSNGLSSFLHDNTSLEVVRFNIQAYPPQGPRFFMPNLRLLEMTILFYYCAPNPSSYFGFINDMSVPHSNETGIGFPSLRQLRIRLIGAPHARPGHLDIFSQSINAICNHISSRPRNSKIPVLEPVIIESEMRQDSPESDVFNHLEGLGFDCLQFSLTVVD